MFAPELGQLRPYPFERLRGLLAGARPAPGHDLVDLSIGEPRHPAPPFVLEALTRALGTLGTYPATRGSDALREAIAAWLCRRYGLPRIDPGSQVLPVTGSREALFSFAQAIFDRSRGGSIVLPNPGYQIYEGAALLAGARVLALPLDGAAGWRMPIDSLTDAQWSRVQLVYACSPGNPTGTVMGLADWARLFELADRHDFAIASDECYSEIYFDEGAPPLGALEAAQRLGRHDFSRLVVFSSLSKRSNVPGLRSGFVAGDARILARYLLYRTYHGCAMNPAVQAASVAAWGDEAHVAENRRLYRAKFDAAVARLAPALGARHPDAAFYLWLPVPGGDDEAYTRALHEQCAVTVLPGSYLGRAADPGEHAGSPAGGGGDARNPGRGYIRMALVAPPEAVDAACERIARFVAAAGSILSPTPARQPT